MKFSVILIFSFFAITQNAYPWGNRGHHSICASAPHLVKNESKVDWEVDDYTQQRLIELGLYDPKPVDDLILPLQSLKRRGYPIDLAGAFVFLASEDAAFITGQVINVDGGWVMY